MRRYCTTGTTPRGHRQQSSAHLYCHSLGRPPETNAGCPGHLTRTTRLAAEPKAPSLRRRRRYCTTGTSPRGHRLQSSAHLYCYSQGRPLETNAGCPGHVTRTTRLVAEPKALSLRRGRRYCTTGTSPCGRAPDFCLAFIPVIFRRSGVPLFDNFSGADARQKSTSR